MSRVGMVCVALALSACGRIAFDSLAGDGGSDANGDAGDMQFGRVTYLKASNADAADQFGASVAIASDGSTIAVGAPLESSSARTINGDSGNNNALEAGAVYIFRKVGDAWTQEAYIKASNADPGDQFGWSVALSGDGNLLVVGARNEDSLGPGMPGNNAAPQAGAAYVFARSGSTWTEQGYMKAQALTAGDEFGEYVTISADGTTVAVGAALEDSSANTINGNGLDDTSMDAGAAYIFEYVGNQWSQTAYIKPPNTDAGDWFGWRVALSSTGNLLAVSAFREDSNAMGVGGNNADDSLTNAGAVYLFTRSGGVWSPGPYIKASNTNLGDDFGYGLALASSGSVLVAGAQAESSASNVQTDNSASSSGAAYVFDDAPWAQAHYLKATNIGVDDQLGYGPAISSTGELVIVGAPFEDGGATGWDSNGNDNSLMDAGAAYLFHLVPPYETRYIKAEQASAGDRFGWASAISGNGGVIAIAVPYEDGSGRGIDAAVDEAAPQAGAVYVYD